MIEFENVVFEYPSGIVGLRGISLSAQVGERVCLLGANGSGKSTLLRLAGGIVQPASGRVLVNGQPTHSAEARTEIGFIFQNPEDQIVAATVDREMAFSLENRAIRRQEMHERVTEVAQQFTLGPLLNRHPVTLSAGEKQRLALAATLVMRPKLLLLDEPTSYLDQAGRDLLFETLASQRELCILGASQYLRDLEHFDRVVYLDKGIIAFDGPVEDFLQNKNYQNIKDLQASRIERAGKTDPAGATPMEQFSLLVSSLSFSYADQTQLLASISTHFASAQITAIKGASGSGKTTLALLLSGLLKPGSGCIQVLTDRRVGEDLREQVALVFQFPESGLFAESVFAEVAFGFRNTRHHDLDLDLEGAVALALRQVGLELADFRDRNPLTLSAGEQRRVAIASILVLNRPVLIFDEVTAGLDWQGVVLITRLLDDLKGAGKTVVVISHDDEFVEMVADRALILKDGTFTES